MRTALLALVAAALPFGLYGHLAGAAGPGAGFEVSAAGRWLHLAILSAAGLLLFAAYRVRTDRCGPGLAAATAAAACPSSADFAGTPLLTFESWAFVAGAAILLVVVAIARRRGALPPARAPLALPGVAVLALALQAIRSAPAGAAALSPALLLMFVAALLAGETADLVARREDLAPRHRRLLVAGLTVLLLASGVLAQVRAASWSDPAAFWDRAVREDPGNPAALGASAGARADSGDLRGAASRLRSFVEALEKGRGADLRGEDARRAGAEGAVHAAAAVLSSGDAEGREPAEAALRAAAGIAPRSAPVLRALGEARLALGEPVEAARVLGEAVGLDAGDAAAWDALSRARLRAGDPAGSLEAAMRATGLRPSERAFAVAYAEALLASGKDADALRVLHGALGPPPRDPAVARAWADAHQRIAERELSAGLRGRALRRALTGLEVRPDHAGCRDLRDRLEREYAAELPEAERWIRPGPGGAVDPNLLLRFAVWLSRWGRYEEAEPTFVRLLLERGGTAAVHFHYGLEFWEMRGTAEGLARAVDAYRDAIARDDAYVEPRARLWQCLQRLGRIDEAREAAEGFVRKAPDHPDAFDAQEFLRSSAPEGPR